MSYVLLVITAVLLAAMVVAFYLHHYKVHWFAESAGMIAIGALFGAIVRYTTSEDTLHTLVGFDVDLFSELMLPIIIFDAGWNCFEARRILMHNIGSILAYAVFGTLVTMLIIAGVILGIGHFFVPQLSLSVVDVFTLAALLSATDPVATLNVFSKLGAHPLMYSLVFGESILNDAVAIILFRTMLHVYAHPNIGVTEGFRILGEFLLNAFGSTAVGIVIGLLGAKYTQVYKMEPLYEINLTIVLAFISYLCAEAGQMSGVIAIFVFGLVARHYLWYNLRKKTRVHIDVMFGSLRELAETVIFVLLGIQLFFFNIQSYHWPLIFTTILACLVARAVNIYPISFLLNLKRTEDNKINFKMQTLMWWAGLRGAVAYALAVQFPRSSTTFPAALANATLSNSSLLSNATSTTTIPSRELVIVTTHSVIIFTILVFGGSASAILKKLHLSGQSVQMSKTEMKRKHLRKRVVEEKWMALDKRYFIRWFSKTKGERREKAARQLLEKIVRDEGLEQQEEVDKELNVSGIMTPVEHSEESESSEKMVSLSKNSNFKSAVPAKPLKDSGKLRASQLKKAKPKEGSKAKIDDIIVDLVSSEHDSSDGRSADEHSDSVPEPVPEEKKKDKVDSRRSSAAKKDATKAASTSQAVPLIRKSRPPSPKESPRNKVLSEEQPQTTPPIRKPQPTVSSGPAIRKSQSSATKEPSTPQPASAQAAPLARSEMMPNNTTESANSTPAIPRFNLTSAPSKIPRQLSTLRESLGVTETLEDPMDKKAAEEGEVVELDDFDKALSSFEADASKSPYEFDSFSGLYFDNVNEVFYDPQTSVHFNPDTGACAVWNPATSSWEDYTIQYGQYYENIWKNSWGGYFEQLQSQQAQHEVIDLTNTDFKEKKEVPSMIRLISIDELTLKDLPEAKAYDIGKYADTESSNKKRKVNDKTGESAYRKVFTIGRSSSNFLVVKDDEVSSKHAEIVWEYLYFVNSFVLKDLGSTNGTFLNEERLNEEKEATLDPVPLEDGDIIRFGPEHTFRVEFTYDYDTEAQFYSELEAIKSEVEERQRKTAEFKKQKLEGIQRALLKVDPKSVNREFRKELLGRDDHRPSTIKSRSQQQRGPSQVKRSSEIKHSKFEVFGANEKEDYERLLQMSTSAGSNPKLLGTAPDRPLGGPSDDGSAPIPESNIGHKLLAKMGWKYGQAVGARKEGITEPVKTQANKGFRGLGFR